MLKIGEFSKLSRVSVRMLRHYDEVGLLAPSEVDPMTGYRYYSERQLITAGRIAALRALGFGLSETRELLRLYDDRAALDARLAAQRSMRAWPRSAPGWRRSPPTRRRNCGFWTQPVSG